MKNRCANNIVAEMQASVNALYIGIKHKLVLEHDFVLIQTDCVQAIAAFERTRIQSIAELQVTEAMEVLIREFALTREFRHVKGHSNRQDARYVANNLCDKRAKYHMRKLRNSIQRENDHAL